MSDAFASESLKPTAALRFACEVPFARFDWYVIFATFFWGKFSAWMPAPPWMASRRCGDPGD
jgi:hypothetical protein